MKPVLDRVFHTFLTIQGPIFKGAKVYIFVLSVVLSDLSPELVPLPQ